MGISQKDLVLPMVFINIYFERKLFLCYDKVQWKNEKWSLDIFTVDSMDSTEVYQVLAQNYEYTNWMVMLKSVLCPNVFVSHHCI